MIILANQQPLCLIIVSCHDIELWPQSVLLISICIIECMTLGLGPKTLCNDALDHFLEQGDGSGAVVGPQQPSE